MSEIKLSGECKITDKGSGSDAVLPICIEPKHTGIAYRIDTSNRISSNPICDYLLILDEDEYKISCLTELKGSGAGKEVEHAYVQLRSSIEEVREKYLANSKLTIALLVGSPDKTLPRMNSKSKRDLCKSLLAQSQDREKISNIDSLVIYIQLNKSIKVAKLCKNAGCSVIRCYTKNGAHIPMPEMILNAIIS